MAICSRLIEKWRGAQDNRWSKPYRSAAGEAKRRRLPRGVECTIRDIHYILCRCSSVAGAVALLWSILYKLQQNVCQPTLYCTHTWQALPTASAHRRKSTEHHNVWRQPHYGEHKSLLLLLSLRSPPPWIIQIQYTYDLLLFYKVSVSYTSQSAPKANTVPRLLSLCMDESQGAGSLLGRQMRKHAGEAHLSGFSTRINGVDSNEHSA